MIGLEEISLILSIVAVAVSLFTFVINYRSRKTEQLIFESLGVFSFLVNTEEIHEEQILHYYKDTFKKG